MCDQTEVSYNDGDVVWVKIGSLWWPGVVKDVEKNEEEKEILAGLKSKPIAIVQFFDEDKYEFIKKLENIYHYNCRRKDEFIKKGLDKYRTGAQHMNKFPGDVTKAESLVDGDPDIINDPKFAPSQKTNYSDIFGSGQKKAKKSEEIIISAVSRKRFSAPNKYRATAGDKRRGVKGPLVFDGCIHYCPVCTFSSKVLKNVSTHYFLIHTKLRVDWGPEDYPKSKLVRSYTEPRKILKTKISSTPKKKPKPQVKTPEIEVKDETPVAKPVAKKRASDGVEKEKKKKFTDALLADWSDGDEDIKFDKICDENENNESGETVSPEAPQKDEATTSRITAPSEIKSVAEKKGKDYKLPTIAKKDNTVSCFDFDEEEEGFIGMSDANTYGRKIPRVIPPKDKTDLGMDLEIEELFKRKPDTSVDPVEETDEEVEKPKKKGRRRKSEIEAEKKKTTPTVVVPKKLPAALTMASTRDRRSGARKSYVNEVIEKVENVESFAILKPKVSNFEPLSRELIEQDILQVSKAMDSDAKGSRRKQDLKRSSLVELDELNLIGKKKHIISSIARNVVNQIVADDPDDPDDLELQVNSLLAETSSVRLPGLPELAAKDSKVEETVSKPFEKSPEVDLSTVEYLEDEVDDKLVEELAALERSPKKTWKELEEIKKTPIAQWQQDIRDAMKANKEPVAVVKEPIVEKEAPVTTKVVAVKEVNTPVKSKGTYYILKPQSSGGRPKILGKASGQQLMVMKTPRVAQKAGAADVQGQQRVRVVSASSPASKPLVQLISDKSGVKKLAFASKKVIQLKQGSTPQKIVLAGNSSPREKVRVIENYNGTGKTVVIKEIPSSSATKQVLSGQVVAKKVQTSGNPGESAQYVIKRIKRPDGKYTIQTISKGITRGEVAYALPKQTTRILRPPPEPVHMQEPIRIVTKQVEPVAEPIIIQAPIEEPVLVEQPATSVAPQMVAMPGPPGPDGQPTYVLLTMDENGVMHTVDSSMMLAYDTQGQLVSQQNTEVVVNPQEELTPTVYSSTGQDILAEALANTNVLGDSDPLPALMIPSVMQEQSHSSILTSLGVPPTIITESAQLVIAPPVVQETSVTLQTPIMTPVEVPTAVIPDTSDLQPPPLPPTPTEEDVLMEESEGGLMIAETPAGEEEQETQVETQEETTEQVDGDFFIGDSQGEPSSFHSMPLLNEESTASEEPIGDQSFEPQSVILEKTSEYLPSSTNPDLEEQQELVVTQEETKDGADMPFITEEGFVVDLARRSQETEVSSTTGDSKDVAS